MNLWMKFKMDVGMPIGLFILGICIRIFRYGHLVPLSLRTLKDIQECYQLPEGWNLNGMTVIDIGCDWGNSPTGFMLMGAAKVIGYERDPQTVGWLKRSMVKEPWFEFRGTWKPGDYPSGDMLKMDIDGGEKYLDVSQLARYKLWFIAIHRPTDEQYRYGEFGSTIWLVPLLKKAGGHMVHTNGADEDVYRGPI
jgi:hypothetical protein